MTTTNTAHTASLNDFAEAYEFYTKATNATYPKWGHNPIEDNEGWLVEYTTFGVKDIATFDSWAKYAAKYGTID